ncbi:hypothetical protein ACOSQ4_022695 [Xanthoceras sorbifolium]
MLLKCERLPEYYFRCGFIGHPLHECTEKMDNNELDHRINHKYGVWLRATSPKKGTVHSSNLGRNSDRQEMHGVDSGRSDGVYDHASVPPSNDIVKEVVVGSVACHAVVPMVVNLADSVHEIVEESKTHAPHVVNSDVLPPLGEVSVSVAAESPTSGALVSLLVSNIQDVHNMSSSYSVAELVVSEDNLIGAESVVQPFNIGEESVKGTVIKGRKQHPLPSTIATASVVPLSTVQNNYVIRQN